MDRIKEIIAKKAGVNIDEVKDNSRFIADLGLNSLELAELAAKLEDEYDIVIEDDDFLNLETVGDVINYLNSIGLRQIE